MLYMPTIISIVEVLLVTIPVLLTVAFVTVAERKTMASMQRRLGPNIVGYYGLLQAFADALKLILKEYVSPTQANLALFFLGPIITLIFSLLGYAVVPYGPGLAIWDFNLGILYMLAVSSLATYGILLAGWSANSKYAFLGSLRSTAQLISYELILSSAILLVILLSGSLNLTVNIEAQRTIWFIIPLLPIFIIFFIGSVAETNRAPFDLAEAESELVSGFMTEHAAVIFVFFFLAEYGSIVLICILNTMLFLGGYLLDYTLLFYILDKISNSDIGILFMPPLKVISYSSSPVLPEVLRYASLEQMSCNSDLEGILEGLPRYSSSQRMLYSRILWDMPINPCSGQSLYILHLKTMLWCQGLQGMLYYPGLEVMLHCPALEGMLYGLTLGIKTCIMIFIFIWVRASFPRIRFDQLMSFSWTVLLPIVICFIVLIPCIVSSFEIIPSNIYLL